MVGVTTVENPYFEEVAGGVTVGPCRDSWNEAAIEALKRREQLVDAYAWAIPNAEAIETIVEYDPIVEIGAGTGYWAWCVEQLDGEILAYDEHVPSETWTRVFEHDVVEALDTLHRGAPNHSLLLCWPPREEPMATAAASIYEGDTLLYVGEGRHGCTATEQFHHRLHDRWSLCEVVEIPTYLGIHDRLEVWTRGGSA